MKDIPHILLVDDDPNIRHLVQLYLEKEGFRVTPADRGDDAMAYFRRETPDLNPLSFLIFVLFSQHAACDLAHSAAKFILHAFAGSGLREGEERCAAQRQRNHEADALHASFA